MFSSITQKKWLQISSCINYARYDRIHVSEGIHVHKTRVLFVTIGIF